MTAFEWLLCGLAAVGWTGWWVSIVKWGRSIDRLDLAWTRDREYLIGRLVKAGERP